MFEEEYPSPGLHSLTEQYLLLQLCAMGIVSSWALGGGVDWVLGYLAALGILSPLLVEGHRRHGHFVINHPIRRYFVALLPVWVVVTVYCLGSIWSSSQIILFDGLPYLSLTERSGWLPSTTMPGEGWLKMLYIIAVYMAGVGLSFVALTTTVIRRLLLILSLNAFALSMLGYIALYSESKDILWMYSPVVSYFSTFTHAQHYAAFGLLWTLVMLGMVLHLRRQGQAVHFMARWGVLLIAACAILASTVLIAGAALHKGLLAFGVGACLIAEAIYAHKSDQRRSSTLYSILGIVLIVAGCLYPVYRIYQTGELSGIPWSLQSELWQNAFALFLDKPLFGWGIGSFETVFALKSEADLALGRVLTPHSDLLHILVEQGIVGLLVWLLPVAYVGIRFLRCPGKRVLNAHLWVALTVMLVLALVSFPLQNPACLFSFWLILGATDAWLSVQIKDTSLKTRMVFDTNEMDRVQKLEKPRGSTQSRLERKRHRH